MTVNVRIAIASHLSDAQEYLELGFLKNASSEINLAKAILFKYKEEYRHEIRKITGTVQRVLGYSGG